MKKTYLLSPITFVMLLAKGTELPESQWYCIGSLLACS